MDLVGMASYNTTVMKFVTRMFNLMSQPPAPGYAKISHTQLLRADRQAFLRLAETVSPPFTENAAGTLPLDDAFNRLDTDVTVAYHMLPIPLQRTKDDDAKRSSSASATNKPPKRQQATRQWWQDQKRQRKAQTATNAASIVEHTPSNPDRKQICFNYNLGKNAKTKSALESMYAVCRDATRSAHRSSTTNEFRSLKGPKERPRQGKRTTGQVHHRWMIVPLAHMALSNTMDVTAILFFCGSAGLTSCMKRLFTDSFGIDHKVTRPKIQVVCLDL